jgi:hypothetical protein
MYRLHLFRIDSKNQSEAFAEHTYKEPFACCRTLVVTSGQKPSRKGAKAQRCGQNMAGTISVLRETTLCPFPDK